MFCFVESILSKLHKIPGLWIHLSTQIRLWQLLMHFSPILFDLVIYFCISFQLLNHCVINIYATELGGKDVEDLFTAVLSPSTNQPPPPQVPHPQGPGPFPTTPGARMPHHTTGTCLHLMIKRGHFVTVAFPNMYLFVRVKETPCFHGCR